VKIEQQQVGTVDVLTPIGPLVDQDAAAFTKALMQRVKPPTARVVCALHEVPYMDSAAVEGLLDASDELAQRAQTLKLVRVPGTCREILELTGVAGRFGFFEETQDAVRSFL
jgi:anti-anti-sigma factor